MDSSSSNDPGSGLRRAAVLVGAWLLGAGGCTDRSPSSSCETDDCDGTTDAGSSTASLDPTGADPTTGSTSAPPDGDTTEAPPSESTGPAPECMVNSDCTEEERCDEAGQCVSLLSAECHTVYWPAGSRDEVELIGSILPTSPPFDGIGQPLENGFVLAVSDFNEGATLPGDRGVALVACDSSAGPAAAVAAAEHLRDAVGTHAILGPLRPESVVAVATEVAVPSDMLVLSLLTSESVLGGQPDADLVWHMGRNELYEAEAITDRLAVDLELVGNDTRVLVLHVDAPSGIALAEVVDPGVAGVFVNRYFSAYPAPDTFMSGPDLLASYGAVLGSAVSQSGVTSAIDYAEPADHYTHVVILGGGEAEAMVTLYVQMWFSQFYVFNPAIPLPRLLVSSGGAGSMVPTVANLGVAAGTEPLLPMRPLLQTNLQGTVSESLDPAAFMSLQARYEIAFGTAPRPEVAVAVDAATSMLLAMVTVPEGEAITGAALASGLDALDDPAGVPVWLGDGGWLRVLPTLARGGTVDLDGFTGPLDWTPVGDTRADVLALALGGPPDMPTLQPTCEYVLGPLPASDGTWQTVAGAIAPCGW